MIFERKPSVINLAGELEVARAVYLCLATENPESADSLTNDAAEAKGAYERLVKAVSSAIGRSVTFGHRLPKSLHDDEEFYAMADGSEIGDNAFAAINVRELCERISVPDWAMRRIGWWRCRYNKCKTWGLELCGNPEAKPGICAEHLPEIVAAEQKALLDALAVAERHAAKLRDLTGGNTR